MNILRIRKKLISHRSPWWSFIFSWHREKDKLLTSFIAGTYKFEPLQTYLMPDEVLTVWSYVDRIFVRTLLYIIKPCFKHIISPRCLHLKGPSGVKDALDLVKKALIKGGFRYFMRVDIKNFYASIDRKILVNQTRELFNDQRVLNYLEQIITIPINKHGAIYNPALGIHRRSSLSPLFGAIYLSPLDRMFSNATGGFYLRFQDDIIVLMNTKRQFCKAKRRLQQVLSALKLRRSKSKTKMGILTSGFHFLGIDFKVNPQLSPAMTEVKVAAAQTQTTQSHVNITLHERCCIRALDKVAVMEADAAHPAQVQRYLSRWAAWWSESSAHISKSECLRRWVLRAKLREPSKAWLGSGLLATA